MLSRFSRVRFFVTPWTVAHQAPLSMGFFRQEYWSGMPCPPPGDFPSPGIEPASLMSPATAGGFFTTSATCGGGSLTENHIWFQFKDAQKKQRRNNACFLHLSVSLTFDFFTIISFCCQ